MRHAASRHARYVESLIMVAVFAVLLLPWIGAHAQAAVQCSPPVNPILCGSAGCGLEADAGFTTDAVPAASCKAFLDGSTTAKSGPTIPGAQSKCKSPHSQLPNALICSVQLGIISVGNHTVTAKTVSSDGQESVASLPLSFGVTAGPPTWGPPSGIRLSAP